MSHQNQKSPTAIFFDFDDTLFDHQFSDHAGLRAVHQHFPAFAAIPDAEFVHVGEGIMDRSWPQVMAGQLTQENWYIQSMQTLFEHYQVPSDAENWQEASRQYRQTYLGTWRIVDGAIDLLEALHGTVKIGVVTNHLVEEQEPKLDQLNVRPYIDFMVCVDEAGAPKPERPMFDMALGLADVQPEKVVMVGDSWSSDVIGATAVGIRTVWLNRWGMACPDPQLVTEIKSLQPTERVVDLLLGKPNGTV